MKTNKQKKSTTSCLETSITHKTTDLSSH